MNPVISLPGIPLLRPLPAPAAGGVGGGVELLSQRTPHPHQTPHFVI